MAAAEEKRALSREEFLRGTAGLAAAGTGMGLLVPSALASGQAKKGGTLHLVYTDTSAAETSDPTVQTGIADSQPALNNTYDRLTYIVPGTWAVLPRLAVSWKASVCAVSGATNDGRAIAAESRSTWSPCVCSHAYCSVCAAWLVEPTDEWRSEGRGRPAQLFRYAPKKRRGGRRGVRFGG